MDEAALFDDPDAAQVAKVAVDVPLAHLDRTFDYAIPEHLAARTRPGVRVKVRFAGQDIDGWLCGIGPRQTAHPLTPLRAVVSDEVLLTPGLDALVRAVADRYAGTWWDVARLAIPPRHAAVEAEESPERPAPKRSAAWSVLPGFPGGIELLRALAAGGSPRCFWQVPPVADVPGDLIGGLIEAVDATLRGGRSAVVLFPTQRQLDAATDRISEAFGSRSMVQLASELGRGERYRNYLAIRRGKARLVLGTRSAAFAPTRDLGLIVVVDDGHDGHFEVRAPHPHARTVATLRAAREGCAILFASHARSCEAQGLIERGWLTPLELPAAAQRRIAAPVRIVAEGRRLPSAVFATVRAALARGGVLVSVSRAGHSSALRCGKCRQPVRCGKCSGPLIKPGRDRLLCTLCGAQPTAWECPRCHSTRLYAPIAGAQRTAEELGRAFPGVPVVSSSADRIRERLPTDSAIVVATAGAEPMVEGGYAAAILLDTDLTLARADLRAPEEAARRWFNLCALVAPAERDGVVLAVGEADETALQALVRCDPAGFAARELTDRRDAGLPPAVKAVQLLGDVDAVTAFLDNDPFAGAEILGPSPVSDNPEPRAKALLRTSLDLGPALVRAVKAATAIRSARKEPGRLSIQVDPMTLA